MKPIISVIVPVYKVEPYLRKCIDSICAQTLREIEIILVDDGSPDNCGRICDEYAAKDSRIRVIHKKNGGLSSARNAGMDIAQADIFGFVDSDDWIDPDMFEMLYQNLVKENADISVCGRHRHENGEIIIFGDSTYSVESASGAVRGVLQMPGVGMTAWNKLYRRYLFSDIRFPEGRIYEDCFIMVRLMDAANRVVFDMKPKYHYLNRSGSITTLPYRTELFDKVEAFCGNYDFISKKYPELADVAGWKCFHICFYTLLSHFRLGGTAGKDKERACIRFLKKHRREFFVNPFVSKRRKLQLLLLCIHAPLCKALVRIYKKRNAPGSP